MILLLKSKMIRRLRDNFNIISLLRINLNPLSQFDISKGV